MSRLGRRRSLTLAATALVALAAPAAAHAATYTVKAGDGACGAGDLACGGLVEAAAIAVPGDVFTVATGTYIAPTFTRGGVTINGDLGVVIDGTLEFAGPPADGVSKMSKVAGHHGRRKRSRGLRQRRQRPRAQRLRRDQPRRLRHVHHRAAPATRSSAARSRPAAGETGAIQVQTGPDDGNVGRHGRLHGPLRRRRRHPRHHAQQRGRGARRPGRRRHRPDAAPHHGGGIDERPRPRREQRAGAAAGQPGQHHRDDDRLDRVQQPRRELLRASCPCRSSAATPPRSPSARTLESADATALFLNPTKGNFRLLPTATAAIGQGGVTAGESATDIDGEDRSAAPTDLGADEYNNAAPTAKIELATATPRTTQPVTFDGRGSSDREGNASIAEYRWRFSDGTAVNTTQPFVQHTFTAEGDAAAGLVVVDKEGAASPEVAVTFKLINGTPPAVAIVKPKSKQTFRTYTTTTKTVTQERQEGQDEDPQAHEDPDRGPVEGRHRHRERVLLTLQKTNSTDVEDAVPLLRPQARPEARLLRQADPHHGAAGQGQQERRVDATACRRRGRCRPAAGRCRPTASTRPAPSATPPRRAPRWASRSRSRPRSSAAAARASTRVARVPPTDPEQYRATSRERWAQAAGGWGAHRGVVQAAAEPVSHWMVDAIDPQPGHRVLELAAGPGDTGFLAAELIEPGGTLISSDAVEEMVDQARARAAELGIANVEFRTIDAEWIDLPTADLDGVLARWGYMLLADPATALRETRRVLRPGGRVALAAWADPQENPWAWAPRHRARRDGRDRAARPRRAEHVRLPRPAAHRRAARGDRLRGHRRRAGPDRAFASRASTTGGTRSSTSRRPSARSVGALTPAQRDDLRDAVDARLAQYVADDGSVALPGLTHVAAAGA